ncbi:hypothetical protein BX666DRAFT_2016724 [Dichotomocladium elegans]|nr:hypothetical protein BX666DRAFT_2016724 [Dichotomocladium elegans]
MALLTTGTTTGLVIDCGNLETSVLPSLLLDHAEYIPPSHLHRKLAPRTKTPEHILTTEVIEDIKTTVLFCSPLLMNLEEQTDHIAGYKNFSSATDVHYPIMLHDGMTATLVIPGWIRERAADVLFEGNDEDESNISHCVLDAILKVQPDLRKPLMQSLLLIGGTTMTPGFQSRLKQELLRIMRDPSAYEKKRYGTLLGLQKFVRFVDNSEDNKGAGRIFFNNVRGWVGGSLMGSLKLTGEEILREKYKGIVTDWSINNWGSSATAAHNVGASNTSATEQTLSTS